MKHIARKIQLMLLVAFVTISCTTNRYEPTTDETINEFIWKGLNTYYLWQKNVPDLADDRFKNYNQLYSHLNNFGAPEDVFENLLHRSSDRFSWIVSDYIALENSFQGITLNNGMEFDLVRTTNDPNLIFGVVNYVIKNSDADTKGVLRGMVFNTVNGEVLTISNYGELLFSNTTNYTIGLADYNDKNPVSNGTSITLNKTQLQENPVAIAKTFTEGNHKIGYLFYNQFAGSFDVELNAAFAYFKSENISDLIVDLRYNLGGSTQSAGYLGAMITGQFTGEVFSKEVWNDKVLAAFSEDNFINHFPDQILNKDENGNVILQENINHLNLSQVCFIITDNTASASELVINSLSAYIDTKLVGTTSIGKQVGSVTLYDSENLLRTGDGLNTMHHYAMQPIVLEIQNKNGENNPDGYTAEVFIEEDYGNLGVLGELSDPLLNRAMLYVTTGSKSSKRASNLSFDKVIHSKLLNPMGNNMYVEMKK